MIDDVCRAVDAEAGAWPLDLHHFPPTHLFLILTIPGEMNMAGSQRESRGNDAASETLSRLLQRHTNKVRIERNEYRHGLTETIFSSESQYYVLMEILQ